MLYDEERWDSEEDRLVIRFEDATVEDLNTILGEWDSLLSGKSIVRVNHSHGALWHEHVIDASSCMIMAFYCQTNPEPVVKFEGKFVFVNCPQLHAQMLEFLDN